MVHRHVNFYNSLLLQGMQECAKPDTWLEIFVTPEAAKAIVSLLSTRNSGYTRREITEKLKISDGGGLSRHLNALLASIRYCSGVRKYWREKFPRKFRFTAR